jgi:hypothetical protein
MKFSYAIGVSILITFVFAVVAMMQGFVQQDTMTLFGLASIKSAAPGQIPQTEIIVEKTSLLVLFAIVMILASVIWALARLVARLVRR